MSSDSTSETGDVDPTTSDEENDQCEPEEAKKSRFDDSTDDDPSPPVTRRIPGIFSGNRKRPNILKNPSNGTAQICSVTPNSGAIRVQSVVRLTPGQGANTNLLGFHPSPTIFRVIQTGKPTNQKCAVLPNITGVRSATSIVRIVPSTTSGTVITTSTPCRSKGDSNQSILRAQLTANKTTVTASKSGTPVASINPGSAIKLINLTPGITRESSNSVSQKCDLGTLRKVLHSVDTYVVVPDEETSHSGEDEAAKKVVSPPTLPSMRTRSGARQNGRPCSVCKTNTTNLRNRIPTCPKCEKLFCHAFEDIALHRRGCVCSPPPSDSPVRCTHCRMRNCLETILSKSAGRMSERGKRDWVEVDKVLAHLSKFGTTSDDILRVCHKTPRLKSTTNTIGLNSYTVNTGPISIVMDGTTITQVPSNIVRAGQLSTPIRPAQKPEYLASGRVGSNFRPIAPKGTPVSSNSPVQCFTLDPIPRPHTHKDAEGNNSSTSSQSTIPCTDIDKTTDETSVRDASSMLTIGKTMSLRVSIASSMGPVTPVSTVFSTTVGTTVEPVNCSNSTSAVSCPSPMQVESLTPSMNNNSSLSTTAVMSTATTITTVNQAEPVIAIQPPSPLTDNMKKADEQQPDEEQGAVSPPTVDQSKIPVELSEEEILARRLTWIIKPGFMQVYKKHSDIVKEEPKLFDVSIDNRSTLFRLFNFYDWEWNQPVDVHPSIRQTCWTIFQEQINESLTDMVRFIKRIPGFAILKPQDRISLVRSSGFELAFFVHFLYWNTKLSTWHGPDHFVLTREQLVTIFPMGEKFFNNGFASAKRLKKFVLQLQHLGLAASLVILDSELPELCDRTTVKALRRRMLEAVKYNLDSRSQNGDKILKQLHVCIQNLRELGVYHRILLNRLKEIDGFEFSDDLYAELFELISD
ncbi:unnamed protein product [Calicophoron daubneyi]|uniref:NR LBD domain-containing protein n=1 Tax=Calicophoron daubneyi TaxID=300641 RepID=A0AAV2TDE3_CALDB